MLFVYCNFDITNILKINITRVRDGAYRCHKITNEIWKKSTGTISKFQKKKSKQPSIDF